MCSGNYDSFFAGRGTGARVCWQWHFSLAFYTTWPRRLLGPPCQSRLRGVFLTVGTPFLASCLLERNRWFWDSAGDFCRVKMKLRVARKKGAAWHLLYLLEFPLQIFLKYKGGLGETHHDPILPSGHWPLFTSLRNHGRWVIGYPRQEKSADGTDATRCLDPGFWVWSYGVSLVEKFSFSKKHMDELRSLSHGYIWLPWLLGFQACHLDTLLEPFFSLVEIAMEFLSKSDISWTDLNFHLDLIENRVQGTPKFHGFIIMFTQIHDSCVNSLSWMHNYYRKLLKVPKSLIYFPINYTQVLWVLGGSRYPPQAWLAGKSPMNSWFSQL